MWGRMKSVSGGDLSYPMLAAIFLVVWSATALAQQREGEARITLATEIVSLTVSVTDKAGRAVSGLGRDDFQIFDEGVRQEISHFSQTDEPASIGVVFDLSGSMTESRIAQARDALLHLIQTAHGEDEFFLIGIGARPSVLIDRTREGEALRRRVAQIEPRGQTALYDAVALALDRVERGRHRRRALIVISDGEDNHSRLSFDGLRRRLRESDVPIWTVLVGPPRIRSNNGAIMDRLADLTGGRSFFPRNEEKMGDAFSQIALELRQLYSIGYAPSNVAADGKWRRIKVMLAPSVRRGSVRTREGYFARTRQQIEAEESGID